MKEIREKKAIRQTVKSNRSKCVPVSNYFRCKGTKLPKQKATPNCRLSTRHARTYTG